MATMSEVECKARVELAACYRLAARFGMTDLVSTHISARIPGTQSILINRYGLLFHEITASNLILIDEESSEDANPAGYLIHTAIHAARSDVVCVMHTHTTAGIAIACQAEGLLPISQHALQFYDRIAYHDFEGIALLEPEKQRLVNDLGHCLAMILRNHGLLVAGRSIAETFTLMFNLESACRIQLSAQSSGTRLVHVASGICELTARQHESFAGQSPGEPEWTALMRDLLRNEPDFKD